MLLLVQRWVVLPVPDASSMEQRRSARPVRPPRVSTSECQAKRTGVQGANLPSRNLEVLASTGLASQSLWRQVTLDGTNNRSLFSPDLASLSRHLA